MPRHVVFGVGLLAILVASVFVPIGGVAEAFDPVTVDFLNVRARPSTDAAILGLLEPGDSFTAVNVVAGEEVLVGNSTWFQLPSGGYVYSAYTRPGRNGTVSNGGLSGRWIEIDRSAQVARAIEDGRVVYSAPVTVGTETFPTPIGSFRIYSRVYNETMDSSTVGIPVNSPNGYYLTGVLYTQYFTDGVALHYNYWSPPEAFGNYPGSHGCIGLRLGDAAFFWNFAGIGTPVIVRA